VAELKPGLFLSGRFKLSRLLGRGAAGEAWQAEDLTTGHAVTLKFCDEKEAAREFAIGGRLVHPNIAAVHGAFSNEGLSFLVREYADGGSIGRLRNAGVDQLLSSALRVADALRYAHELGIVHRDLKPSNVICDDHGFCKLTDFGAAAISGDLGPAGVPAGSLPYMSPQQLDGALPVPADDIYGFGALLYDLLTGEPLFHPDVSTERIRNEMPGLPSHSLANEPLPPALIRLLRALLEKTVDRRPPGMSAVSQALEEIIREAARRDTGARAPAELIRPRSPTQPGVAANTNARARLPTRAGVSARSVYLMIGALIVAGAALLALLPRVVRGPNTQVVDPGVRQALPAVSSADQKIVESGSASDVDNVLAELLRLQDMLKKESPERWAKTEWAQFNAAVASADTAYRARDFAAAKSGYDRAVGIARTLQTRFPIVLKGQIDAGEAALAAGDPARALTVLGLASTMEPANDRARQGLERAQRLDEVLGLMAKGEAAEKNGERNEALQYFRRAAGIDPQWKPAGEGVRRLEQSAADEAFRAALARGYTAAASRDLAAAQAAFDLALRLKPGDAAAKSALEQLGLDRRIAEVSSLRDEAAMLENKEQWVQAADRYERALKLDATGQPLLEGLARSRDRAEISASLDRILADADHLNDPAALSVARRALERARRVTGAGPALARQISDADKVLSVAAIPVNVQFESDGVTEIVIYTVGKLGAFTSRTLALRPGSYVAVGTRQGYRDVRRRFRVSAEGSPSVVTLRCEDAI
jgi:tetratricopeptide (TPR) repeat protein